MSDKDNVVNIGPQAATIEDVLEAVRKSDSEQVYCIGVDGNGHMRLWASGNIRSLSDVALAMNVIATDHIRERM